MKYEMTDEIMIGVVREGVPIITFYQRRDMSDEDFSGIQAAHPSAKVKRVRVLSYPIKIAA